MAVSVIRKMQYQYMFMLSVGLLLLGALPASVVAQECEAYADRLGVSAGSDPRVTVEPYMGGGEAPPDTEAIQCAFELAADNGIGRVQLQEGDFYLTSVTIEDFNGSFEGRSIAKTHLNLVGGMVDCAAVRDSGRAPAAIRFVGGEPALRTMTINATNICMEGGPETSAVVRFTGLSAFEDCDSDLVKGQVDRVVINGEGIQQGIDVAIAASPEGFVLGTCRNTLLGTFKVNRSEISGFNVGVATSMHGGAQVDVNFNTITNTRLGYVMNRSRQITSVAFNHFSGASTESSNYIAVFANAGPNPPDKTALSMSNNTIELGGVYPVVSAGFYAAYVGANASLALVARENTITGNSDAAVGFALHQVSNAVVINNRFLGSAFSGVWVGLPSETGPETLDNAILANTFMMDSTLSGDVLLESAAVRTVVGPGQNAQVVDQGQGSILTDNIEVMAPGQLQAAVRVVD